MGRMVANQGNGQCFSTADPITVTPMPLDIVLVPPPPPGAPTPVVNTAKLGDAVNVIDEVKVNDKPIVVKDSYIPTSSGAPPNAIKGIASRPPANNECKFTSASSTVYAGGRPIIRHRELTTQNAANCVGAVKLSEAFTLTGSGIALDASLTPAEVEQVLSALEDLASTPRGYELLQQMQNPATMQGHTATISTTAGGNACTPATMANATGSAAAPGVGSGSTVTWNPTSTSVGGVARPPSLGLGHEMIHALHAAMGILNIAMSPGTRTLMAELQCIGLGAHSSDQLTDNALREERGIQTRNTHNGRDILPYTPAPGSVPPKGYRLGAGGKGFVYAG